ncbi:MAG: peptide deformylase [Acidobacteriota bacterium]
MAILKVAVMGNPVLRKPAETVSREELTSPAFQRFLDDLIDTMREYDGVGIAAPQVHVGKRAAVMEVHQNPRYPQVPDFPLTVLINPTVTFLTEEEFDMWEGCLSVPDIRGKVPRRKKVRVDGIDRHGTPLSFEAESVFAAIVQHELDHLDGKLFVDRVRDTSTLTFLKEYHRYWIERTS